VRNDPVNIVDPSGLRMVCPKDTGGVIYVCHEEPGGGLPGSGPVDRSGNRPPQDRPGSGPGPGGGLDSNQRDIVRAVENAASIFSSDNECSNFFGGEKAAEALKKLGELLTASGLDNPLTGIQMSNFNTNVTNTATGLQYRLPASAVVNTNGPFFRGFYPGTTRRLPDFGDFSAGSKEVRVLMILHELSHLIKGADGKFLIPDDGPNDPNYPHQSEQNTEKISDTCKDQIKSATKH
jgi:hypothetical protein